MVMSPVMSGTQPRRVLNLASFNFTGVLEAPEIRTKAKEILREYGVGSCSPPGFYGTSDMHIRLEKDIAARLGKERCIVYSQGFSTISGVIPAFAKRGDIIVADAGLSYAAQKALQLSRSTIFWYDHNDMASLEMVLQHVCELQEQSKGPLKRRFMVTESIFESDGAMSDLPQLAALKKKYRFRLMLDETYSFGTIGERGRGLTAYQNVDPADVDFIIGNLATSFGTAGGFCASSVYGVQHQRINGQSFVFSAAMPVMLAVGSSVALQRLAREPQLLTRLHENAELIHAVLDKVPSIYVPSTRGSPLIYIQVRSKLTDGEHDLPAAQQSQLLQAAVDDALNAGVFVCCTRRLPSINAKVIDTGVSARPSIRISVTAMLERGQIAQAADVLRASLVRVLGTQR